MLTGALDSAVLSVDGSEKSLVRTFTGVNVVDNLVVALVPRGSGKKVHQVPILSAIEVHVEPSK